MPVLNRLLSIVVRAAAGVVLGLALAAGAHAQALDFNRFISGGGGGTDPRKQRIVTSAGVYMCLGVNAIKGSPTDSVRFTLWSLIPEQRSRISAVAIDTGRFTGLFSGVAVTMVSPGVKAALIPPQPHPFLAGINPAFWVALTGNGDGLAPGNMLVLNATLAPGRTLADVTAAISEGLNPATAEKGLRVGVLVLYLLGGPPPGVATINDDGGFVTTGMSATCGSR